jgi:hypothetical protein
MAQAKITTDHDEIRKWAEARGGRPAAVRSTYSKEDPGIIRIESPDAPNPGMKTWSRSRGTNFSRNSMKRTSLWSMRKKLRAASPATSTRSSVARRPKPARTAKPTPAVITADAEKMCQSSLLITRSPVAAGGEGRVKRAVDPVCSAAHLTLPLRGPLPLRLEGRRGDGL